MFEVVEVDQSILGTEFLSAYDLIVHLNAQKLFVERLCLHVNSKMTSCEISDSCVAKTKTHIFTAIL